MTLLFTVVSLTAVLTYRSPKVPVPIQRFIGTSTTIPPTTTEVTTSTVTTSPTISPTVAPTTTAQISYFSGPAVSAGPPGAGFVFGIVRVEIAVRAHQILAVDILTLPPTGDTDGPGTRPQTALISVYAAPILRGNALKSQGRSITTLSGATYTCRAFRQSLQFAMREAKL